MLTGEGGLGKTTIAAAYYHRYKDRYKHLVWLTAERGIRAAFTPLAMEMRLELNEKLDETARMNQVMKHLSNQNQPLLLVIDNADDPNDLSYVLPHLRKYSSLHILLTTRCTRKGQGIYTINPLTEDEARKLFLYHYRHFDQAGDETLDKILEAIGYNTLVVELLAKNLNNFNSVLEKGYPLMKLLADIQRKGVLGLTKTGSVATDYRLQHATPQAIIGAMYNVTGLARAEKALLSVLALLPPVAILYDHLTDLLPETSDLHEHLLAVHRRGWVEFNENQRSFMCSPVVQEIVRRQNSRQLVSDSAIMVSTLIDRLKYEPTTGTVGIPFGLATAYIQYAEGIAQHLSGQAGFDPVLLERIGNFYRHYGNLDKALEYFEDETTLFSELYRDHPGNVGFKNGLAISYAKLGLFYLQHKGDRVTCRKYLEQARNLWAELVQSARGYAEFSRNLDLVERQLADI